MKSLLRICLTFLPISAVLAQITLTQTSAPIVGQSESNHAIGTVTYDCTSGSGNINWDLTGYAHGNTGGTQYVDPTTTPFSSSFPSATLAATVPGTDSWSYSRVGADGMWYLGFGTNLGGGLVNVADEEALLLPFPCTYGTSWTGVIRVTFEPIPGFSSVSVDSTLYSVNAWGNLITPLWTESALRILSHKYVSAYLNGQPFGATTETWDYQFVTTNPLRSLSFSSSGATGPEYQTGDLIFTSGGTIDADPVRGPVASSFSVGQNYPNPFNPSTSLPVELSRTASVSVTIYNEVGQVVEQFERTLAAGSHLLPIDGSSWSSGSYFAKVTADHDAQTTKMMLIK